MSQRSTLKINQGYPQPFGATVVGNQTNFALFYPSLHPPFLCLFKIGESTPFFEGIFDPVQNRTGNVWHMLLEDLPANLAYTYKIMATDTVAQSINHSALELLDPYARGVITHKEWNVTKNNLGYRPLGAIIYQTYNWEGDTPLNLPIEELIIYEIHVRAFTQDPSSGVDFPGTFHGLAQKIDHFRMLGINAVELLPIQEFNEGEYSSINPITQAQLCNFWGYSTVNFFSIMGRYTSTSDPLAMIKEFKDLVKLLHKNGIEVILDVVFNHTSEGNEKGPNYSFKGLANSIYYFLDSENAYENYSGCGNTLNCNHPVVIEMIISSLQYWVTEMHIDGFRFDLAAILSRDYDGRPVSPSPLIERISNDPILANTKLIAEPWDAVGLYQVGNFYTKSERWYEWNGKYQDNVRRFTKGTPGTKEEFATRLCGSQDLYHHFSKSASINYITSHDGFSLADLVAYNHKHNIENGENNHDGNSFNNSWNCGCEGTTLNEEILWLRQRQMRNFLLALLMSQGVPMITMGDEYGHTKFGNNNTWCQDNQLNWFLWDRLENNKLFRFTRLLMGFRKTHPAFKRRPFLTDQDIEWHGVEIRKPQWQEHNQFIAFTLKDPYKKNDLYLAFNSQNRSVSAELPKSNRDEHWHWVVNTANFPPEDFMESKFMAVTTSTYNFPPHSAILLQME